jgi:rRNA maturation protein Nop10
MSVEAVAHKGRRKNTTRRCGDFLQAACFTLGLCFCEQSGGMTKTALPIRFKPAWAGYKKQPISHEVGCNINLNLTLCL